ncbi:hypothetical protein NPIL_200231 [Nephila pilipes]|uniref:Uncharacterized protein n=1 Tax=Nephila pilipes TaxID=299642 RepID=A0A8X6QFE4_NEPPI|nr:hypothetical protein NPIL_200231 [Nephila pilipes]
MLQGKRFGSNEEVIAETEAYFEAKDNFFYKHGIEKLEKRWNDCITLKVSGKEDGLSLGNVQCSFPSRVPFF